MRGNWDGHNFNAGKRGTSGSADIALNIERIAVSEGKLAAWRDEHPDAMGTWTTKHGCVVAFGGMKVYYGRCRDCGVLVTTRRANPPRAVVRGGGNGRWPTRCAECSERKRQEHDDKARARMAKVRAERKQARRKRLTNPKYDLFVDPELVDGLTPDWLNLRRGLAGKSLGIRCLDCGEPIKFALHITFPRPIPGKTTRRNDLQRCSNL